MLKKILVATAIFASTATIAMANGAPYIGAGIGITNNSSTNSNFRGLPINVMAGYGAVVNENIYLAGEVFGTLVTPTLDNNGTGKSLKTTYGYGISFIPGFMLSDHSMIFARLGVIKAEFSNVNNGASSGELGIGLQTGLTQNWDIRGEYDYMKFGSFSGIRSAKADQFNLGLIYKFE